MSKLNFYKYAAFGLLLLNLALVAFFFLTKPRHPGHPRGGPKNAKDSLQLDEQQHEAFLENAKRHTSEMEQLNDHQRTLLQTYFQQLFNQDLSVASDSLLGEFQLLEKQKIESVFQHFQAVQSILRPEQMADFESFVRRILNDALLPKKNNRPPPKDF